MNTLLTLWNRDACDYSPAGAANAVTVGASTIVDERAYFSNYGPCVSDGIITVSCGLDRI